VTLLLFVVKVMLPAVTAMLEKVIYKYIQCNKLYMLLKNQHTVTLLNQCIQCM
jgi:hypothetical protein